MKEDFSIYVKIINCFFLLAILVLVNEETFNLQAFKYWFAFVSGVNFIHVFAVFIESLFGGTH